MSKQEKGFTLVELMVVVAVMAILTAIAYPMYQDQVRKSRRSAVKGSLLQMSQYMERNYTEALRYDEDAGGNSIDDVDDVLDAPMFSDFKDEMTRYYNLSLVTTNTTYTIQAVPKAGQSGDKCGTLGLLSTGNRTAGHADCW